MTITAVSPAGSALIQRWESCRLAAYLDSAGIATIGWGTIRYPDGRKVRMGETCTAEEADQYFRHDLTRFELAVNALTVDTVRQREFDALVSFSYNVGEGAYRGSTLRKKVNANPSDTAIRRQFMKWYFAGGKPVLGLWRRRHSEADHYTGIVLPIPSFPGAHL